MSISVIFLQQGGVSAFQKLSGILRTYVRGFSVISCVVILQTSDRSRFSLFRLLYGTSYAFFPRFFTYGNITVEETNIFILCQTCYLLIPHLFFFIGAKREVLLNCGKTIDNHEFVLRQIHDAYETR